jgi:hypothetical protein
METLGLPRKAHKDEFPLLLKMEELHRATESARL